jgi:putative endonuclease
MTSWFGLFKNTSEKGAHYERVAELYLRDAGLTCVERNYRCKYGEIDLIMQEQETFVFVEVKYRGSEQFGGAVNSLSAQKMQKLRRAIAYYCQVHRISDSPLRIDFVAIDSDKQCHWIKNLY